MSLRLLMDQHVHGSITSALRHRGVDVLTAEEDGSKRFADPNLLDRAGSLARVLVSYDSDLLGEANRRQRLDEFFSGLFYIRSSRITIGGAVDQLELACKVYEPADMENRVEALPLR